MLAQSRASAPLEACGLLLGADGCVTDAVPTANVAPDPSRHFEIDPAALIAAHRAARDGTSSEVVGYFHSHPNGLARPSDTDRASANGDGRVWAIVAGGDVTWWLDATSRFEPLSYTTVDG